MSFTLLTLPGVSFSTSTTSESGNLALECVSDDKVPLKAGETDPSVALSLHLNSHVFNLVPHRSVILVIASSGERLYTLEVAAGTEKDDTLKISIPPPTEDAKHVAADIETFDQILTQYTDFSWSYSTPQASTAAPPTLPARPGEFMNDESTNIKPNVEEHKPVQDPSLRGKLLLMDEANGDIVGELPEAMHITEDPAMPGKAGAAGDETDPVVLEMHPDMYDACTGVRPLGSEGENLLATREVFVRAVPPEEQDWLMKGATLIRSVQSIMPSLIDAYMYLANSQAISSSTSLLVSGITSASNYYIAHSAPGTPAPGSGANSPAAQSSPSTANTALAKAHALSGQARAVTTKTADVVEGVIRRAMGGKPKASTSSANPPAGYASPAQGSPAPQGLPPPYAVYMPKARPQRPGTPSEKSSNLAGDKTAEGAQGGEPVPRKPLRRIDRVLMSADLVLTTVDDSARRMFEVSSDRLGAVVGHKCVYVLLRWSHIDAG